MRRTRFTRALALLPTAFLAACASAHPATAHQPSVSTSASAVPSVPPKPPVKLVDAPAFPHVETSDLPNQVHLALVERSSVLVELRVIVESGSASDGPTPGVANVAALAVARSYAVEAKSDALAAPTVGVEVGPSAMTFAAHLAPDGLGATLAAMGRAMAKPHADVATLRAIQDALASDVVARARDEETVGHRFATRDLFLAPVGRHPDSIIGPTSDEVRAIDDKGLRAYLDTHLVARNVAVVAVGPTTLDALTLATQAAFAKVGVGPVAPLSLDPPEARPNPIKVMLVDDPKRDPVLITVARFAPPGEDDDVFLRLGELVTADRMVASAGGDATFRLHPFREMSPIGVLEARVPAAGAVRAIAELANEEHASHDDPSADAATIAKNEWRADTARTIDAPSRLADALAAFVTAGKPESSLERDDLALATAAPVDVGRAARGFVSKDTIVVVVGSAATLSEPLSALGIVDILDPTQGFARTRSIPKAGTKPPPPPPDTDPP